MLRETRPAGRYFLQAQPTAAAAIDTDLGITVIDIRLVCDVTMMSDDVFRENWTERSTERDRIGFDLCACQGPRGTLGKQHCNPLVPRGARAEKSHPPRGVYYTYICHTYIIINKHMYIYIYIYIYIYTTSRKDSFSSAGSMENTQGATPSAPRRLASCRLMLH